MILGGNMERDNLADLGIDFRIILKWIGWSMVWIGLSWDRDNWWVVFRELMDFCCP